MTGHVLPTVTRGWRSGLSAWEVRIRRSSGSLRVRGPVSHGFVRIRRLAATRAKGEATTPI